MRNESRDSLTLATLNQEFIKTDAVYKDHDNHSGVLRVSAMNNNDSSNNVNGPVYTLTNHRNSRNSMENSAKLRTFILIFLSLSSIVKPSTGFGEGSSISANFEQTYCRSRVHPLNRAPNHNDPRACGGSCSPRPAPRDMYTISANTTVYSIHNVEVTITAIADANILGFAVVAISEQNRTVGRWLVQGDPNVMRATCDSLLEGQVIFHARSSSDRKRVVVTWDARRTNFGRIFFRTWIVQRHSEVFQLDSQPLTNPLNATAIIAMESRFNDIISTLTSRHGNLSSVHQLTKKSRSIVTPTRNGLGVENRTFDSLPAIMDNSSTTELMVTPNSTEDKKPEILTLSQFENAFSSRLLSGYNLSVGDPLAEIRHERYLLPDFLPSPRLMNTSSDPFRNVELSSGIRSSQRPFGQIPQQFPDQFQRRLPRQQDGQFLQQGQFSGQLQGQFPWQQQGQFPGQLQSQLPWQQQGQFFGQLPWQSQEQFLGQSQNQNSNQMQINSGMSSVFNNFNFNLPGTALATNNPPFGTNSFQNPAQFSGATSWQTPWNTAGSLGVQGNVPFQNGALNQDMQFQMMINGRSDNMVNQNGASQRSQFGGGQSWSNTGNGQNSLGKFADRTQMFGR